MPSTTGFSLSCPNANKKKRANLQAMVYSNIKKGSWQLYNLMRLENMVYLKTNLWILKRKQYCVQKNSINITRVNIL